MVIYDKVEAGKRLSQIIGELGLNSRQFAFSIKGDPSYLAKMEKGDKGISKTYLLAIEEKYGIKGHWILFGEGPKNLDKMFHVNSDQDDLSQVNEDAEPYGIKTDDKSMLAEMIRNNRILSEANKIHAQNVQALLIKVGISSDTFGEASASLQGKGTASKKPFAELQDKTSSGSEKSHQKQKDILKS